MKKFKCEYCSKTHNLVTKVNVLKPLILDENSSKVNEISNRFWIVNKEFALTEASFSLKVNKSDLFIEFNVWVKIDPDDFIEKTQNLEGSELRIFGKIYDSIPMYLDADGIDVELVFVFEEKSTTLPQIVFLEGSNSELEDDWKSGIPIAKLQEFSTRTYHSLSIT